MSKTKLPLTTCGYVVAYKPTAMLTPKASLSRNNYVKINALKMIHLRFITINSAVFMVMLKCSTS